MSDPGEDVDLEDVLSFWFSGTEADRGARWWSQDPRVDADIRARFGGLSAAAVRGELDDRIDDPWSCLAVVILLDQLPRNMYRRTPRMFEGDERARAVARFALDEGFDDLLELDERLFLTLPLEHGEDLALHDQLLARYDAWRPRAEADGEAAKLERYLDFARRHRDIVARFGRFPHRNAILGRESTPEEVAFLATPGSSFL